MFYVYRFLDTNENVIYVGKSKQELVDRFKGHLHLPDECYSMVYKIEYIECDTEADMSIKEIYYINKYQKNAIYFNLLDNTELPSSVVFNDSWVMYTDELPRHFSCSINYTKGFKQDKEKKVRITKSGKEDRRKNNKIAGVTSYVDPLTKDEVNLITDYLIDDIKKSENNNQKQIRFRNLVMFVMGVNLPIKITEFLKIKFKDV